MMAQIANHVFSRYFSSCSILILTVQHQEIVLGQGPWILKKDGLQRKIKIKRNKQTKETDDCHPFPKWIHAPDFGLCAEKNHRQSFVKKGTVLVGEISGAVVAKTGSSEKPPHLLTRTHERELLCSRAKKCSDFFMLCSPWSSITQFLLWWSV